jgi:hypothetical protein
MSIAFIKGVKYENTNSLLSRTTFMAAAIRDMRARFPAMNPPRYVIKKSGCEAEGKREVNYKIFPLLLCFAS